MDKELKDFIMLCDKVDTVSVADIPLRNAVENVLYDDTAAGMKRGIIKQIMKCLWRKKLIFDETVSLYYEIAMKIDHYSNNTKNYYCFSNEEKWLTVIKAAKNEEYNTSFYDSKILNPRMINTCENLKFFKDKGLAVNVDLKGITFDYESNVIKEYVKNIENTIKLIGAQKMLKYIFSSIRYNPATSRYTLTRNIYKGKFKPSVPYGFLIALCLKNIKELNEVDDIMPKITRESTQNLLKNTCFYDTTKLLSIYDVESYNSIEDINLDYDSLLLQVHQYAFYDSNFLFIQDDPKIAIDIVCGIFKQIPTKTFENIFGLSLTFAIKILKHLFEKQPCTNIKFSDCELSCLFKLNNKRVKTFLDLLSHTAGKVNNDFNLPSSLSDFIFKPFIKLSESKYLLVNNLFCATNIYESFLCAIRNNDIIKDIDKVVGHYVENYIYEALYSKGIDFKKGNFVDAENKISGESDLMIQKKDEIFCFEFKKKPFTRLARAGEPLSIMLDLFGSLLDSQMQASKIEIILKKDKKINLDNKISIVYNNENIQKISISTSNFGAFHDDNFMRNFILTICRLQISTTREDLEVQNKCKTINRKITEYNKQLSVMLGSLDARKYLFGVRFIPLSFFMFILNRSNDINSFTETLMKNKNISSGSMDIWEQNVRHGMFDDLFKRKDVMYFT